MGTQRSGELLRALVAVFPGQRSAGLCPLGAWLVWYGCIYRVLTAHSRHTRGVLHGVLYGQRSSTSCALRLVTAYCMAAHQSMLHNGAKYTGYLLVLEGTHRLELTGVLTGCSRGTHGVLTGSVSVFNAVWSRSGRAE